MPRPPGSCARRRPPYRRPTTGRVKPKPRWRCALRTADWLGHAALDGGRLVGWIGAIRTYSHGWEIHPLVVAPDRQRRGIGSALMAALEARARREGVLTLFLGSDDDYGGTSLFGRDLWPGVLSHAAATEARRADTPSPSIAAAAVRLSACCPT